MRLAQISEDDRIAELEARLAHLQSRIERLESKQSSSLDGQEDFVDLRDSNRAGAEYWIGAKLVPRLGAILIVVAIAVIAILESSKSADFNRAYLLIAETVFCLAFVAVGEWKRNELEGFGQTLAAIGSCGLYLTAAGGHFAYGSLTAAGMAAGFAVLTLLNHAYAVWRNTRLFFFIGASGGLAGMLFPLVEKDYGTVLSVYVIVTLAGAAVCANRKWMHLAIVGWLMGLLILAPVMDSSFSPLAIVAALYSGSLACIAAFSRSCAEKSHDLWSFAAPAALIVTGIAGFWVMPGANGTLHLLVLAALSALASYWVGLHGLAGISLLVGSVAVATLLAPLGLPPIIASLTLSSLAAAAFVIGKFRSREYAAGFALAETLVAAIVYAIAGSNFSLDQNFLALFGLVVAGVCAALSMRAAGWGWMGFAVASGWILLSRVSLLFSPMAEHQAFSVLTLTFVLFALLLLVLGFRNRCATLRMWSFVVMAGAIAEILIVESGTALAFRLGALLAIGVMMLVGGYRYVHDRQPELKIG